MRPSQLRSISFPAYPSVRISTVFQHCRRAFLLCSSTQCCTQCTHCYCIPALCACIPTIFKHFSGCIYTRLYVKCSGSNSFKNKRHGPIRNPFDKMAPDFKTSWRDLYDEICSISTSSIPTTTRSDRTSNASCRFSHFGIHVPLNSWLCFLFESDQECHR